MKIASPYRDTEYIVRYAWLVVQQNIELDVVWKKLSDNINFKGYTKKWKNKNHKYNKVFGFVDWQKSFFFSVWLIFHEHSLHRTAWEGVGCLFNSLLTLPTVILKRQSRNHCRELTYILSQQTDSNSNQEPLVSERKSVSTTLCALNKFSIQIL